MVFSNTLLAGSSAQGGSVHSIDQSIRFNNDDDAYMSRTQDTADSKRKLTFSWWMKIGSSTGTERCIISAGASSRFMVRFNTSDKLTFRLTNGTTEKTMTTDMVFRDNSAWYHCVWSPDCTGGISSDFSKFYVNGARVTMTGTQPSADTDFAGYGDGSTMAISSLAHSLSVQEFDGYLAEMVLIDGTALDPSSFGEYNSSNIWIPKDVSGLTFGTNGFHIDGRDASDLGDDESGNGNDFTTSGLATHDQMADTPTNNHAVMNLLDTRTTANWTASNGNLDVYWQGNSYPNPLFSTLSMPATGKWYFEIEFDTDGSGNVLTNQNMRIGLMREDINAAYVEANASTDLTTSSTSPEIILVLGNAGNSCQLKGMGSNIYNVGGSISAGDRINFAREGANLWIGKNGTYYNSGNPATGSNPTLSNLQLEGYRANMHWSTGNTSANCIVKAYFGADKSIGSGTGFNDTVPSGFLALNTTNLGS